MNIKNILSTSLKNILWLLILILLGIGVFLAAPLIKKGPQKLKTIEHPVKVRAITVSAIDVIPRVIGYGRIAPGRTWEAVAEVAGQVKWIADDLRDGHVVKAGDELLQIEVSNYQLALAQAEAQLRASKVKKKTAGDALVIARRELKLLRADYQRKKVLARKGTVAQATLDAAERPVLSAQTQIANLQNSIDLNTAEHQVLIAHRDAAKLDLARTRLIAPFDARITTVKTGVAQYANKGQLLFSADGLDVAEVAAQFAIGSLRPLVSAQSKDAANAVRQGALNLKAIVRLRTATHMVEWTARISRVTGSIDPQTQSIGVVAAIDHPTKLAKTGERPPLFRNTFVEIELFSSAIKKQIVVPLSAIHQGKVYLIDTDKRLVSRKVKVKFSQKGYAVIREGVKSDDQIVISDLLTAVEGMLLAPQEDKKTRHQMIVDATGKEPTK